MLGMLLRFDYTPSNKEAYIMYKSIVDIANKYCKPIIGIVPSNLESVKRIIDMCDGIILSGGDKITKYDKKIIKYIYDNDIPCLGICMGMQEMGLLFNGKLRKIKSHDKGYHKVNISGSKKFLSRKIKVNTRHHEILTKTDLKIVGKTNNGDIEMIEAIDKKFFLGVQWHPENLNDNFSHKIFDTFFKSFNKKTL